MEKPTETSDISDKVTPYVDKAEVKEKVKKFLLSKGYSENEVFEDVVLELRDTLVLIDLLVKVEDKNKILILCDSMESEVTDLLTGRTLYALEAIPPRNEIKEMQNPYFDRKNDEKIKKVISGLYSMKCRKCGI
jgi:hypothetical protein